MGCFLPLVVRCGASKAGCRRLERPFFLVVFSKTQDRFWRLERPFVLLTPRNTLHYWRLERPFVTGGAFKDPESLAALLKFRHQERPCVIRDVALKILRRSRKRDPKNSASLHILHTGGALIDPESLLVASDAFKDPVSLVVH